MLQPKQQLTWRGSHRGLPYKITHWGIGEHNDGKGTWCYYVYIPEHLVKDHFASLWLEPRLCKITPESHGFVTHHYYNTWIAELHWHGGVTFYDKHGELEGHRLVEFGCDFAHLWDAEMNYEFGLDYVAAECEVTLNQIANYLKLPEPQ